MLARVVGCSHHGTSIALRERLAFSQEQLREALDHWRRVFRGVEAVILSTCNRVEIYAATEQETEPGLDQIAGFLARFHGLDPAEVAEHLYQYSDDAAVQHLFSVASSLDSMVLGETQILAQVKEAYQTATEQDTTGPLLHAAFQAALRVAHRVAKETTIHQRRVSIPSVAVADFARQVFERFDDKHALVLGAGEMAEEMRALPLRRGHPAGDGRQSAFRAGGRVGAALERRGGGVGKSCRIAGRGRSGGQHDRRQRAGGHGRAIRRGRGVAVRAAAADSRLGRAPRLRARDRRSAQRVSLFDRRFAGGLRSESGGARSGTARGACTSSSGRRSVSWPRCGVTPSAR